MLERLKHDDPPSPDETLHWYDDLMELLKQGATISERNRIRDASKLSLTAEEAITIGLDVPKPHWDIGYRLFAQLKVIREIMRRIHESDRYA